MDALDSGAAGMLFTPGEHRYALGSVDLISVTTLLRRMGLQTDYAGIPASRLQRAATRGLEWEAAVLDDMSTCPALERMVTALAHPLELRAQQPLVDAARRIAGQADLVIAEQRVDGAYVHVVDLKATAGTSVSHAVQVAGYCALVRAMTNLPADRIEGYVYYQSGDGYRLRPVAHQLWQTAVTQYQWSLSPLTAAAILV
jgi:hypothetical protein